MISKNKLKKLRNILFLLFVYLGYLKKFVREFTRFLTAKTTFLW